MSAGYRNILFNLEDAIQSNVSYVIFLEYIPRIKRMVQASLFSFVHAVQGK